MKERIKISDLSLSFYYSGFFIYILFKLNIVNENWHNIFSSLSIALLLISLILNKYTLKYVFLSFSLIFLGIIIAFTSGELNVLFIFLLILAGKNADINSLIKMMIVLYIVMFVKFAIGNTLGWYNDSYALKYVDGVGKIVKAYGFGHPNQISARYISFVLLCFYYYKDKLNWKFLFLSWLGEIYIYNISESKTGLLMLVIISLFFLFYRNDNWKKLSATISCILCIIVNLIGFSFPILYIRGNHMVYELDKLVTGRFRLAGNFFQNYGLKVFGQPIENGGYDNILDSATPYIILSYGIFFFILINLFSFFLYAYCFKNRKYIEAIIYNLFFIIGVTELTIINPSFNFTFLFFILVLNWSQKKSSVVKPLIERTI
ncbi:hypothetical protein HAX40_03170 [Enterococcus casseliflavus]|nr:hypothetical protein [Enterococcus casseliflavus]